MLGKLTTSYFLYIDPMFVLPRNNAPYISFTSLVDLIESQDGSQKEVLQESSISDDLSVSLIENESSAKFFCEKSIIAWDVSEYTEGGEKGECCKQQIEYFLPLLSSSLNEQEALQEPSDASSTEISSSDDETLYAEELEERQVLSTIDEEEGDEGSEWHKQEIEYSAERLRFLTDKQAVKRQYFSSAGTFMPVASWRQTFVPDETEFSTKGKKAQQAMANLAEILELFRPQKPFSDIAVIA